MKKRVKRVVVEFEVEGIVTDEQALRRIEEMLDRHMIVPHVIYIKEETHEQDR